MNFNKIAFLVAILFFYLNDGINIMNKEIEYNDRKIKFNR